MELYKEIFMKTASFFTYKGPGRISIARYAPKWLNGLPVCGQLAPGNWFNSVSKEEYIYRYKNEILKPLNPQEIFNKLTTLAGGFEPVLLCWEKPPFDDANFCHRRLVADWFKETLGVDVPEITPVEKPKKTILHQEDLFAGLL